MQKIPFLPLSAFWGFPGNPWLCLCLPPALSLECLSLHSQLFIRMPSIGLVASTFHYDLILTDENLVILFLNQAKFWGTKDYDFYAFFGGG